MYLKETKGSITYHREPTPRVERLSYEVFLTRLEVSTKGIPIRESLITSQIYVVTVMSKTKYTILRITYIVCMYFTYILLYIHII